MPLEPTPGIAPPRVLRPCVQRPDAYPRAGSRPLVSGPFRTLIFRSVAPRNPPFLRTDTPVPLPSPAGGVLISGALVGATGGTQTHSRRTGRKLGRLRYARQGLVRVPESNTKYGGKGRKTGGDPPLPSGQVSVSPQGFPRRKNLSGVVNSSFAPLFTGQLFIVPLGLPCGDSREATGGRGLARITDRAGRFESRKLGRG